MEYGLIGEKLGHSYSVMIHARLAEYAYELREIAPEALDDFIAGHGYKGLNVTIPYKKDVIPHCDELSEIAQEAGSVNTLLVRPDGTLYGHNTDIGGFIYMLKSAGIDPQGKKVVILGTGGTSLTARLSLKRMGAREIVVVSRSGPVTYDMLYDQHGDAEILVNTTPVGMYPKNGACPADISRLPQLQGVVDAIYNPEKTALILDAQERGIPAVSGLTMLVAQAHEAAQLFAGREIPSCRVQEICAEIRAEVDNLVLVGMPGCGKSTLGQAVAEKLGKKYVDCDQLIVERVGMSIPDIFAKYGEKHFRDLESQVIADVCRERSCVIATGGGAILRPENVRAMRQNSRVAHILRGIEDLPRDGRPLSSSQEAVNRLWQQRKDLYAAAADYVVNNNQDVESAVRALEEGFYEAVGH